MEGRENHRIKYIFRCSSLSRAAEWSIGTEHGARLPDGMHAGMSAYSCLVLGN